MKIRLASPLQRDSIVDGEGIRTVIWTQGCSHNCSGCHNPSTHDFKGGFLIELKEVLEELETLEGQEGITFSGGDPLFQANACAKIAKRAHELGLNTWCYTGFTFEELLENEKAKEFLDHIDVLVDGKFIIEQQSLNLDFRGSKNQRIIDVPKSLKANKTVLVPKYIGPRYIKVDIPKKSNIYI